MGCNTCKKKPANNVSTLTGDVNLENLKMAATYVQLNASMTPEKWDFVEQVYQELYPGAKPLNRGCSQCLRQMAKVITHEYNKRANK